ncbi:MAG: MspA family porin [Rhodococcus sp. (in: high G+C Gram-positive bacteria)]|uniref:MspA family porin n=1 Tax=Rhodococcus sp. TaxID=1831 RepID=UPI002AD8D6E7|nr:MspA family porin [Rhodococcus sp. (in: high G+C Gram-positive bacteria)]
MKIDGPDAASFTGTKLTIGYQIGYLIALTGARSFFFVLVSTGLSRVEPTSVSAWFRTLELGLRTAERVRRIGGDIIPSQELDVDLAPGGFTDVALLEDQESDGPEAAVDLPEFTDTYREQSVR